MIKEEEKATKDYCCVSAVKGTALAHTTKQAEEELLRNLDRIEIFPNGKNYFVYCNDEYFEIRGEDKADLSHLVKVDSNGNVISKRFFAITEE
jgi:hypothetical protein